MVFPLHLYIICDFHTFGLTVETYAQEKKQDERSEDATVYVHLKDLS